VDPNQLLDACSVYDTWIAWRIRHDELYDKVVLPADELLEVELEKAREAEARPARSEDGSQFTWTSDKDKAKSGDEGSSSLAKEAEKSEAKADNEDPSSPAKDAEK
jgi:hypothetical protein